ncbi:MAG: hypothetical protein GY953_03970 [bacterium]|nr:hypothetical protein [bacterium]
MSKNGKLSLRLFNAHGEYLNETVSITLRNQDITESLRAQVEVTGDIVIPKLSGPPRNRYLMELETPSYRPVRRFVSAAGTKPKEPRTITLPVHPARVTRVEFPNYDTLPEAAQGLLGRSQSVLSFPNRSGRALYKSLDDIRRAGLLNIIAKTGRTMLGNGRNVLSYLGSELGELTEVRGDRFFARVPHELREETKSAVAADIFEQVSAGLHHPPQGFSRAGSFKTKWDDYGNLQLTFFARRDQWMADIDIDDAAGLAHVFQVVRNTLTGNPTHPYDIQQILLIHQELDPGYRLRMD